MAQIKEIGVTKSCKRNFKGCMEQSLWEFLLKRMPRRLNKHVMQLTLPLYRGHILNLSYFKDDSSSNAWDYSAWVRSYALFLEERLECYHVLKYDIETERLRTRELDTVELLRTIASFAAISLSSNAVSAGRGGYIQTCDTVCTHSGFKGEH